MTLDLTLISPPFALEEVRAIAASWLASAGDVIELGSQQDRTFLVAAADGRRVVVKIANRGFGREALRLQNAAMAHAAAAPLPFLTPVALPTPDGRDVITVSRDGQEFDVRALTYIDGTPLRVLTAPAASEVLGTVAAHVARALADLEHPAARRRFQWSLDDAPEVVARLRREISGRRGEAVAAAVSAHAHAVEGRTGALRRQVVHGDVTEYNVVLRSGGSGSFEVGGLIDFGDVAEGFLVGEAAIAAAAAARCRPDDPVAAVVAVARAFHAVTPLTEAELAAFFPLVLVRSAVSALSSARQAALDPGNAYVTADVGRLWHALEAVAAPPPALVEALVRAACGLAARPRSHAVGALAADPERCPIVDGIAGARPVDLSTGAEAFAFGEWQTLQGVRNAVEAGSGPAVGRWGEARIVHADPQADAEPATLHLGVDLFVPAGAPVRSPVAAEVERVGSHSVLLRLGGEGTEVVRLRLAGVSPTVAVGEALGAGRRVGEVAPAAGLLPPHVHVQLVVDEVGEPPGLVRPSLAAGWLALCPDPSALIGVDAAAPSDPYAEVLGRRRRFLAPSQQLFYDRPPWIERGWRQHLYDTRGRAYLDMVNNVAVVGHAHPGVAAAASAQMRRLNTNSRFLYDAMGRFAERLVALVPPPLDTVFLVNSGSEANDLALRLARTTTGRTDVVALWGAYHGWTTATFALNSSPFYPEAGRDAPPWLRTVPAPNPYRGPYGPEVPDAGTRYAEHVRDACRASAADGAGVAAFIAEPQLGNAGGVLAPPGYLAAAYAHVRAAGGVCIADEVQVGYGRLGRWFWGFEQQGAVPDIVTVAKPAGNGHPIGAVITTRAIADRFRRFTTLFSSVGGGPVSCRVGIAVLDAIRDEGLQANAARVGDRLRAGLDDLHRGHELIGAVHGAGLHQGVELVRDRETKEPATEETAAICERMLELGIVVRPTGDYSNVLKVKPPLCVDGRDADRFVDALGRVLGEARLRPVRGRP